VYHLCGRGEVHTEFWWGNLRERDQLEDPGLDGRTVLSGSSGSVMGGGVMDWIELAQIRYKWRDLVNAVMNVWVS